MPLNKETKPNQLYTVIHANLFPYKYVHWALYSKNT